MGDEHFAPSHLLVEAGLLERNTDQKSDIAGMLYDVDPADPRPPSRRREEGCEHANHRRLSGAIRAKKSVDLARFDLEIDARDRIKIAEAAGKTFCAYRRIVSCSHDGRP